MKNSIQNSLKRFESLGLVELDEKKIGKHENRHQKTVVQKRMLINNADSPNHSPASNLIDIAPVFDMNQMEVGTSIITNIEADHRYYQRGNDSDNVRPSVGILSFSPFLLSIPSTSLLFYL